MKTASIIIPTFNRSNFVTRAIDSALQQTYPCEIIVCDHGSTDKTPEVVSAYGNKIKYIRRDVDKGPIVCWRDGLENSNGDIIHFNYDDDWMEPQFMEKSIELLKNDVGLVYSRYFLHSNDNISIGNIHPFHINPMKNLVKFLLYYPLTISPSCAIFRKKDAIKNLLSDIPGAKGRYGKNSGVGEDLLLFLLTSLDYSKYAHINEPLVHFLSHPGSITTDSTLSGCKNDLEDAYTNAKRYFLVQSKSLFYSSSEINQLLFKLYWRYKSGTLIKELLSFNWFPL